MDIKIQAIVSGNEERMDIKQQSNEQIKGNECTLVCVESTQQEHGRKDSYEKHSECLLCSGQTIRENVHLMGLDAMPHPTSALFLFAWLKKKDFALDPWEFLENAIHFGS
uniref:AlNc14C86G5536 protein n=1 Tax=Albugo laibachii Nc14 TaxID=890382 RepID=F0WG03_9STRA|nr:AlNc14C86G5536 [Albugo laibachii Nc14]|eukprot:CCA20137.1 AlNc14C86G5536 [Albugo laibachii Nc14]